MGVCVCVGVFASVIIPRMCSASSLCVGGWVGVWVCVCVGGCVGVWVCVSGCVGVQACVSTSTFWLVPTVMNQGLNLSFLKCVHVRVTPPSLSAAAQFPH